jgi:hypothetical protein
MAAYAGLGGKHLRRDCRSAWTRDAAGRYATHARGRRSSSSSSGSSCHRHWCRSDWCCTACAESQIAVTETRQQRRQASRAVDGRPVAVFRAICGSDLAPRP